MPEEVLSQSEVEALIASAQTEDVEKGGTTKGAAGAPVRPEKKGVQPYSFHTASFLTPIGLRRVRIKHEEFVGNLSAAISSFVRGEFSVRLSNLETVSCRSLAETMAGPTHLTLHRLDPLAGLALVEVSLKVALTVVGRLLGGKGTTAKDERNLTEIELGLVSGLVDTVMREYVSLWRVHEPQLKATPIQNETSARFLKLGHDQAEVFLLTMEGKFNDCVGNIRLAFLQSTLEPLIKKLVDELPSSGGSSSAARVPLGRQMIPDISIPVHARWNGLQLTVRELSELRTDDVLVLDPTISTRTTLTLSNADKFLGQVGRRGDHLALRITSKIQSK